MCPARWDLPQRLWLGASETALPFPRRQEGEGVELLSFSWKTGDVKDLEGLRAKCIFLKKESKKEVRGASFIIKHFF